MKIRTALACCTLITGACSQESVPTVTEIDLLIRGGMVYSGQADAKLTRNDVGIDGDRIVFVGEAIESNIVGKTTLDASGSVVSAGFIDPHTHSEAELLSRDKNANLNYLFQGVTTVFIGNDGGGRVDVGGFASVLSANGIGTNTAVYVGHGALRREVMAGEERVPSDEELVQMSELVRDAMRAGALGLSTGLFYAPGSYSDTAEVIALAAAAAEFDGIYDSHLRDESNYNIGVVAAVEEAIEIGKAAGIAVHIAHIKALGVDVWDQSDAIIKIIETARAAGQAVTADQYPWRASGTHMRNALLPKHLLEGTQGDYLERLRNTRLSTDERAAVAENLRRRGGPETLLVVVAEDESIVGLTLAEIAAAREAPPVETALDIIRRGSTRVASFNMKPQDIEAFMVKDWVMTSSDGTDGHPRKYASFPQKYRQYVRQQKLLSLEEFLFKSSALTADTFDLSERGRIDVGNFADVIVIDLESFAPSADFKNWDSLSTGIRHAIVNGQLAIRDQIYTGALGGRVLLKNTAP